MALSQPDARINLVTAVARPKVVLHDHLDGGLRPSTLYELARPADRDAIADILAGPTNKGSLTRYLAGFAHTVAVTQSAEALSRIAAETVADMAADGVVYTELRFAPELHPGAGSLDDAVDAVLAGLGSSCLTSPAGVFPRVGLILSAIRTSTRTADVVDCALRFSGRGVVGVDLAGDEIAGPVRGHAPILSRAGDGGLGVTIHAGEASGCDSVFDALAARPHRLGHGVALAHDISHLSHSATPGDVCRRVRDAGIVLEVCPSSNVHTGVVSSLAHHPIDLLRNVGLLVTVSPDNRLMSATTASNEFALLGEVHGWTIADLDNATDTALDAAFISPFQRALIRDEIRARRQGHTAAI